MLIQFNSNSFVGIPRAGIGKNDLVAWLQAVDDLDGVH